MLNEVHSSSRKRMEAAIETFRHELASVRTGRASFAVLDSVRVDYYGTPTPLNQVANLAVPEGNLITVSPWDPGQIGAIERAILKANLGLTPSSDGKLIRVPVPPLTEDRRKELARKVHGIGEEAKTVIRNLRREANEQVKALEKDKKISQDDEKKGLKSVQDLTDEFIAKVESLVKAKEKEILEF